MSATARFRQLIVEGDDSAKLAFQGMISPEMSRAIAAGKMHQRGKMLRRAPPGHGEAIRRAAPAPAPAPVGHPALRVSSSTPAIPPHRRPRRRVQNAPASTVPASTVPEMPPQFPPLMRRVAQSITIVDDNGPRFTCDPGSWLVTDANGAPDGSVVVFYVEEATGKCERLRVEAPPRGAFDFHTFNMADVILDEMDQDDGEEGERAEEYEVEGR